MAQPADPELPHVGVVPPRYASLYILKSFTLQRLAAVLPGQPLMPTKANKPTLAQRVKQLEAQEAQLRAELAAAQERETATAEVLEVISRAPANLQARWMRSC